MKTTNVDSEAPCKFVGRSSHAKNITFCINMIERVVFHSRFLQNQDFQRNVVSAMLLLTRPTHEGPSH